MIFSEKWLMAYGLHFWQFEAVLKNSLNVRLILKRLGSFEVYFSWRLVGESEEQSQQMHFDFSFDFVADFIVDFIFA